MQPLTVDERSYIDAPLLHIHNFYQIVFPRRGRLHLRIGGRAGAVGPQAWAIIHPGMDHLFWAPGENRFLVVDLAAAAVEAAAEQLGLPAVSRAVYLPLAERPAALAALLGSELAAGGPAEGLVAESLRGYIGSVVARALAPATQSTPSPAAQVALRARDYLEVHALRPLRLADLAAAVGASEAHVQRSFRARFGLSVVAAVQQIRLAEARRLLEQSDMPVHAIAAAVGFESQSYFTRLFAREVGVPPARYRALRHTDRHPRSVQPG